jgi:hypothetical protein
MARQVGAASNRSSIGHKITDWFHIFFGVAFKARRYQICEAIVTAFSPRG